MKCKECDKPATRILEWSDLDGNAKGPEYLCARHCVKLAEAIQSFGGSPRIGNV